MFNLLSEPKIFRVFYSSLSTVLELLVFILDIIVTEKFIRIIYFNKS